MKRKHVLSEIKSKEKDLGIPESYQYDVLKYGLYFHSNWFNNKLTTLEALVKLSKNKRVLDLGCGSGIFELTLANKVKEVVAIDRYKEALVFLKDEVKKQKIKNIKIVHEDILNLSKIDKLGKFDIILLLDVIEHLKKKEIINLIKSTKELLKPEGLVYITTPNYKSTWSILEKLWDKLHPSSHLEGEQHITQFDKNQITTLFNNVGFKTKHIKTTNLFSFIIPNKNLSKRLSKAELSIPWPIGNLLIGVFEVT